MECLECNVKNDSCAFYLIVLIILLLFYKYGKKSVFTKRVNLIPGPKYLPILGNAYFLLKSRIAIFHEVLPGCLAKYGPIFRIWNRNSVHVFVHKASDIRTVLQDSKHDKGVTNEFFKSMFGKGLFVSNGETWRLQRKIIDTSFHRHQLHSYLPVFNKHAATMAERLSRDTGRDAGVFRITFAFQQDVLFETLLNYELKSQLGENYEIIHAIARLNKLAIRRFVYYVMLPEWLTNLTPTAREMKRHIKTIRSYANKVVVARKKSKSSPRNDNNDEESGILFVDALLEAERCNKLTMEDVVDQIVTFIISGNDTIEVAVSWILFIIGTYPQHQEGIVSELCDVFGETGRMAEMADLSRLSYLERCILEIFRLYPPGPFIEKTLAHDVTLGGYTVPAGCNVTLNLFLIHRDPEIWREPEKFDPDRFLPQNIKNRDSFAFIPFSAGARSCIGKKFAMLELLAVISTILRRFRIEAAYPRERIKLKFDMILYPVNGLKIRLFEREDLPKLRVAT